MNKIFKHTVLIVLTLGFTMHIGAQKFIDNFQVTHFKLPIETTANSILEDSFGFVWIGTANGLWRYNGSTFKNYVKNENDIYSITDNNIFYLYEDKQKVLWVGTYGGGLLKYDRDCDCFQRFIHDKSNPESLSFNEVRVIFETKSNQLYIGTDGGGLNVMNRKTNTFKSFQYNVHDNSSISHNNVLDIEEINDGNLAIGTWVGLNIFNPKTQKFKRIYKTPKSASQNHHNLEYFNEDLITNLGDFLIYTSEGGLKKIDIPITFPSSPHKENDKNCWFLSENTVSIINDNLEVKQQFNLNDLFYARNNFYLRSIFHNQAKNSSWLLDRSGNFFHIEKRTSPFKPFFKEYFNATISQTNSNYWITKNDSVYILSKSLKELKKVTTHTGVKPYVATLNNNNVWVVDNNAYYEFSPSGELLKKIKAKLWPFALIQTKNKELWVGEVLRATKFEMPSENTLHFECDPNQPEGIGYFHKVYTIFEDSKGQIWLGTEGDGLKKYLPNSQKFKHYRHEIGNKETINNNFVNEIFEDNENNLWLGTQSGLCRYDEITDTFIQCENPIIKDKIVNSIEQDNENNLWIGTLNGLIKYNYKTDKIRVLNEQDGVLSHKIWKSSLHLDTGELVFQTNNGLMVFNPNDIKESDKIPLLYISKLWVNNEIVAPNSKYISKNIEVEEQVEIDYDDRKFELEFQVINYNNNGRCKYAYKLDGYDKSWVQAHDNQKATYTNIPSGNYTFMVKASNEDGVWDDEVKSLKISIKPPFWELLWVQLAACFGLIFIFIGLLISVVKRERNRSKFEIEKQRMLQFEEVAKMKLTFFTNISHELRTPLTLITSPLDKFVREKIKPNNKVLEMMYRNSSRLLELVNQILDFRKLENNQKLQATLQKDFSVFNNINASAAYWAKEKTIKYKCKFPEHNLKFYFDADVLEKIVTNLISNAFKYTPEHGNVELKINYLDIEINTENKVVTGKIEIHVIDNGLGIPLEYHQKVFERFYQLDENPDFGYSSGIGLSLTAELVKLHKGTIELKSNVEKGCHFKVEIPIGYEDYLDEDLKVSTRVPDIKSDSTLILIVEDNHDIRNYLQDELKDSYQIIEAVNGKEGLQMAIATLPDVIISDIMMPESDGIQLANQLKSNELTSHIPLLFLTAKIGEENKLEGLSTGAEDYIQKPFNISEIKLKIRNLLEGRKQLLLKYKKKNNNESENLEEAVSDKYLEKVNSILQEYIEDSEFSIDKLCSELAIGRSQLYRKIQVLTGKSIIEYINFYRLSVSMQLIKEGKYTLKEIAYKVGYNDNRYFSRSFKKEFGHPPSHYVPKQ
jgi:signal transduction histidine kinase/DNA-binding response OmpR family regulator/ligand-binding sensor domain-containing protein